jgi:hypothetical protein
MIPAPAARIALLAVGSCVLAGGLSACATTEQESARIARENQLAAARANAPQPSKHSHHGTAHNASKRSSG